MKIVLQRVNKASVSVDEQVIGQIGKGVLLYVGFGTEDAPSQDALEARLNKTAEKIAHLRIFPDAHGRFHLSLLDIKGSILLIPNFTLYGDVSKGRRPDFFAALAPDQATLAFQQFGDCLRKFGIETACGQFGAHMLIESINDGPVTMILGD